MAEFMFKKMVKNAGREKDFLIESAATSNEEIGCISKTIPYKTYSITSIKS